LTSWLSAFAPAAVTGTAAIATAVAHVPANRASRSRLAWLIAPDMRPASPTAPDMPVFVVVSPRPLVEVGDPLTPRRRCQLPARDRRSGDAGLPADV
jgi:hypothetical protein